MLRTSDALLNGAYIKQCIISPHLAAQREGKIKHQWFVRMKLFLVGFGVFVSVLIVYVVNH